MEPKKFASLLEDDAQSVSGRDGVSFQLFRPQSPAPSSRFTLRRSIQSSRSSISASSSACSASHDPSVPISCVTHETFKDDCGTHRFIVWAAVKRNNCERMTDRERLECPLLRCTLRFPDHESMLRHLVVCEHLSSSEYWCYDHMRIERFDDSRCKKCLGHPSKRRKMLSAAKHFFTTIGHTKGRSTAGDPFPPSPSFLSASVSPCSSADLDPLCEFIDRNGSNHYSHRDGDCRRRSGSCHHAGGPSSASAASSSSSSSSPSHLSSFPFLAPPPPDCEAINGSNHVELPTSEIPVEIDSKEVAEIPRQVLFEPTPVGPPAVGPAGPPSPPPLIGFVSLPADETQPASINPQALLLPELESMNWEPHGPAIPFTSTVIDNPVIPAAFPSFLNAQDSSETSYPDDAAAISRPSLPPATQGHDNVTLNQMSCGTQMPPQRSARHSATPAPRSKNLSPSSSVRSTTSTTSTTSAMSAMSAASYSSTATTVSLISNTDSLASPISDCSPASNQWLANLKICQTSPTTDFDDLFADDLFADTEETNGTGTCEKSSLSSDATFILGVQSGTEVALPDNHGSNPFLFGFDPPLIPPTLAPEALAEPCVVGVSSTTSGPKDDTSIAGRIDTGPISIADSALDRAETISIVTSAWYLLMTRIVTSAVKLQSVGSTGNQLAALLLRTPPEHIATTGIQAMQMALISGDETMPPFTTLCFLHAVYAFSLIAYGPDAASRSDEFFTQALVYSRNFASPDHDNYLQVVSAIWQPNSMSSIALAQRIQSPLSYLRRKVPTSSAELALDNPVIAAAKAFLDDLEASAIIGSGPPSVEVQNSSLIKRHTQHQSSGRHPADFNSSASLVLRTLLREFPKEVGMASGFDEIHRRVSTGALDNVRRLELELHRAGKASFGLSSAFFDIFVPRTRRLCDHIYASHESAGNQRPAYYEESTLLVLAIIAGMKDGRGQSTLPADCLAFAKSSAAEIVIVSDTTQPLPTFFNSMKEDIPPLSTEQAGTSTVSAFLEMPEMEVEITASEERAMAETPTGAKVEVESHDCCEICGYRPKGDPQWFRGSMNKHMKTKHSGEVIYKCPYPNCNSQYRNRLDNLQQHQKEKNHFVGSETVAKKPRRQVQAQPTDTINEQCPENGAGTTRRPSKRKKMSN